MRVPRGDRRAKRRRRRRAMRRARAGIPRGHPRRRPGVSLRPATLRGCVFAQVSPREFGGVGDYMRQTLRRRDGAIRRRRSRRLFAPVTPRVVSRRRRRHQRRDGVRSAGVEVRERVRGRDGRNVASRDEQRRADATVRVRGIARRRGRRAGAVRRDSSGGDARRSRSVRAQTRRTTRIQGDDQVVARRARIRGAVRGVGGVSAVGNPRGKRTHAPADGDSGIRRGIGVSQKPIRRRDGDV